MDAVFYRGTTPSITCEVEMDLTDWSCYLSVGPKENKPWFTADNSQMTIDVDASGETPVSTLVFTLTQAQTLACKTSDAHIQLRAIKDGTALATDWGEITIGGIIKDGAITDDYDTD
jgi:hypothetical protein